MKPDDEDYIPPEWEPYVLRPTMPTTEELLEAGFDTNTMNQIVVEWRLRHPDEPIDPNEPVGG